MEKNYISALKDWYTATSEIEELTDAILVHSNNSAVITALVYHLIDCVANREEYMAFARARGFKGDANDANELIFSLKNQQKTTAVVNSI